jgi:hypothetical protein
VAFRHSPSASAFTVRRPPSSSPRVVSLHLGSPRLSSLSFVSPSVVFPFSSNSMGLILVIALACTYHKYTRVGALSSILFYSIASGRVVAVKYAVEYWSCRVMDDVPVRGDVMVQKTVLGKCLSKRAFSA